MYGGDGLGREADGRAVFVPYVLPGELVEAAPEATGAEHTLRAEAGEP